MSVRPYIRPSAKCFSDSDEIWYVGRGRWVMHDGMPYDPIQGQGHETFKVWNSSIFKISSAIFNESWQMTTYSGTTEQSLTFVWSRFLISVLVFVSHDFELGRVSVQFADAFAIAITFARWQRRSQESTTVQYGTNFYFCLCQRETLVKPTLFRVLWW